MAEEIDIKEPNTQTRVKYVKLLLRPGVGGRTMPKNKEKKAVQLIESVKIKIISQLSKRTIVPMNIIINFL